MSPAENKKKRQRTASQRCTAAVGVGAATMGGAGSPLSADCDQSGARSGLPYSTRFVIDRVLMQHHAALLKPLVLGVLVATGMHGATRGTNISRASCRWGKTFIADFADCLS